MKQKNALMIEQREISFGGKTYTRRAWDNGTVTFYRHDRRRACLVKLDSRTNAPMIDRLKAVIAREDRAAA